MQGFVSIFFDHQSKSKPTTVINKINDVDHVEFSHLVTGDVDAIAFVNAPDQASFRETLLAIRSVSGVDSTSTNVVL